MNRLNPSVIMEGVVDTVMHEHGTKEITPSHQTRNLEGWPRLADITYSKIWIVLDGSDPEDPLWLEIERPMIPSYDWQGLPQGHLVGAGTRVRVTMEVLPQSDIKKGGETIG